jgi:aryl-alcohol dehydrogenase-like predicted oxidoreductase
MEKRKLGKTDMHVSVLGFGGAELGFQPVTQEGVTEMLNAALDAGLNVIDTANAYLESEKLIGNAVGHRRKEFFLFTKCGATEGFTRFDWTKDGITKQIEESLKALRTDYVDLIQLHSCSADVLKKGEAIETLRNAREKGLARYIGYSGDSYDALYAVNTNAFDTLQTSISIADQEAIDLTLPVAREKGMGVIAKRPIANAAWRTGQKPVDAYHHAYWDRLQKLDYDFLKKDLKDSIATALRFTYSIEGIGTIIVGTTKPGRWKENAEILEAGKLSQEELQKIRARWKEVADESWTGEV